MHWEFANGTWAARHEGNVWGIQVAKDGKFVVINPDGDVVDSTHSLESAKTSAERQLRRLTYSGSEMEQIARAFVRNMTAEQFQALQLFSADVAFTLVQEQVLRANREAAVATSICEVANE